MKMKYNRYIFLISMILFLISPELYSVTNRKPYNQEWSARFETGLFFETSYKTFSLGYQYFLTPGFSVGSHLLIGLVPSYSYSSSSSYNNTLYEAGLDMHLHLGGKHGFLLGFESGLLFSDARDTFLPSIPAFNLKIVLGLGFPFQNYPRNIIRVLPGFNTWGMLPTISLEYARQWGNQDFNDNKMLDSWKGSVFLSLGMKLPFLFCGVAVYNLKGAFSLAGEWYSDSRSLTLRVKNLIRIDKHWTGSTDFIFSQFYDIKLLYRKYHVSSIFFGVGVGVITDSSLDTNSVMVHHWTGPALTIEIGKKFFLNKSKSFYFEPRVELVLPFAPNVGDQDHMLHFGNFGFNADFGIRLSQRKKTE